MQILFYFTYSRTARTLRRRAMARIEQADPIVITVLASLLVSILVLAIEGGAR